MIFIYSGDVPELDQCLRDALPARHRILVIPSSPRLGGDALAMADYLRTQGLRPYTQGARAFRNTERLRHVMMNSDAVFLLGGNTFEFLDFARTLGLFELLAEFESQGGIIASESAGSIILSPTIATAAIPTHGADDHLVSFDDYSAMGRIPFHVSPHFDPQRPTVAQDLDELRTLAHATQTPVALLRDGEGLIMEGSGITQVAGTPQWILPSEPVSHGISLPDWTMRIGRDAGRARFVNL